MISTIRAADVNRVPASKARERLADILSDVAARGDRVILHRHGKDVAAVISMDDLALLESLEDRYDVESARATLADSDERIPWAKLKKQLGL
jgi:prevent-host-death family protein